LAMVRLRAGGEQTLAGLKGRKNQLVQRTGKGVLDRQAHRRGRPEEKGGTIDYSRTAKKRSRKTGKKVKRWTGGEKTFYNGKNTPLNG